MTKVLVISDTHINPASKDCPYLWAALARYCIIHKPDCIVHLGDVADLDSQAWLVKNRGMSTLEHEMEAVEDCLQSFHGVLDSYNSMRRAAKKKMYKPSLFLTLGNHDVRNNITDVDELFTDFGWYVSPYLEPVQIDGYSFCHCLRNGLSDNMCTTAKELLENWHGNIVVGHGHHRDFHESYSLATNSQIMALKSPCFMLEPSEWAVQTRNKWSLGFTEIDTETDSFIWRGMECL